MPDQADAGQRIKALHRWRTIFEQLPVREAEHRDRRGEAPDQGMFPLSWKKNAGMISAGF